MTNPLTQSDVVNNLNSTSTTTPLSAYQGKLLNDTKASIDLGGSSSNTHLIWSAPSADEKYATPVHWDNTVGYSFIYIDGVKHYLLRRDDIANNLTTNSSVKPLSAAQGYIMSRDIPWYGTSSTVASTIEKTATTSDSKFVLTTGAKVSIKFTYENTASAPTLNVDSTGAKSIKAYGTTTPTSWWKSGDVVTFTYDGTNWIMSATEGQISQINSDLGSKMNSSDTSIFRLIGWVNDFNLSTVGAWSVERSTDFTNVVQFYSGTMRAQLKFETPADTSGGKINFRAAWGGIDISTVPWVRLATPGDSASSIDIAQGSLIHFDPSTRQLFCYVDGAKQMIRQL